VSGPAPVRIAVIGYRFGQNHVMSLLNLPEFRLVAVADGNSPSLGADAERLGFRAYADALEMVAREELDAVSVCVSPKFRPALLEALTARGLALFVEKPWASHAGQAEDLLRLCQSARAPVMSGFSFRFLPVVRKLKREILPELGAPFLLSGAYVPPWLPGGKAWLWDPENGNGFFNENSCHLLDVVCDLLGEPLRVQAMGGRYMERPMEDAAGVLIGFASGAVASLAVGGVASPAFQDFPSLDLYCAGGQAQLRGHGHIWNRLRWAARGDAAPRDWQDAPEALGQTRYSHALRHFAECLRQGIPPEATPEHGALCVRLAMAIQESLKTGEAIHLTETRT
jgi:predicted dehydrogenase